MDFGIIIWNYGENVKLCYMDTDRFIFHVNTDDIYKDIYKDSARCWNKVWHFRFLIRQTIVWGKYERIWKKMKEFVWLRAKRCSYSKDNNDGDKKPQQCVP